METYYVRVFEPSREWNLSPCENIRVLEIFIVLLCIYYKNLMIAQNAILITITITIMISSSSSSHPHQISSDPATAVFPPHSRKNLLINLPHHVMIC